MAAQPDPLRWLRDRSGPIEVDRLVNACGQVGLAGVQHPIGYHLAGQRVTVRLDRGVMQILDRDRTLLRSLPNPLPTASGSATPDQPDPHPSSPTSRCRCSGGCPAAAP